jgi:hypothetical protein
LRTYHRVVIQVSESHTTITSVHLDLNSDLGEAIDCDLVLSTRYERMRDQEWKTIRVSIDQTEEA